MTPRARVLLGVLVLLVATALVVHFAWPVPAASAPMPTAPARPRGDKAKAAVRILFVGNSYTFVNDLPGRLRELSLAEEPGQGVYVESRVLGGATLHTLWDRPDVVAALDAGGFTHVVIQGQSVETLTDPGDFQTYAARFVERVKRMGAIPVLYETWARKAGDPLYREPWTGGGPAAMQATVRAAYERAAKATGATLARVGDVREAALAAHPALALYEPDGTHPSALGADLGAWVVLEAVRGKPIKTAEPTDATPEEVRAIRDAADVVREGVRARAAQPP